MHISYIHIYIHIYTYVYAISMWIQNTSIGMDCHMIHGHTHTYVCMYVCMYVCIYVYHTTYKSTRLTSFIAADVRRKLPVSPPYKYTTQTARSLIHQTACGGREFNAGPATRRDRAACC